MAEMMTQGWYVGLGAGYDRADAVEAYVPGFGVLGTAHTDAAALITGSFGYRFPDRIRVEGEFGWDSHNVSGGGSARNISLLANAAYDFKLGPKWDYTIGAGAGVGELNAKVGGFSDTHQGFMWQAFTGFDYWIRRDVSVNLDWRYRSLSENAGFFGADVHFKNLHEQALMLSVRWYPWSH
jgi:opacity protein-like surface antigen